MFPCPQVVIFQHLVKKDKYVIIPGHLTMPIANTKKYKEGP
jgi:hypothetical protein